jgi:hypothetical protein
MPLELSKVFTSLGPSIPPSSWFLLFYINSITFPSERSADPAYGRSFIIVTCMFDVFLASLTAMAEAIGKKLFAMVDLSSSSLIIFF